MKTLNLLRALPLLSLLVACQQQPLMTNAPVQLRQAASQAAAPLTAKMADDEAKRLAKQWSPTAALSHVLGHQITSAGQPHASTGSWTFSFVDLQQPGKALQIVFTLKGTPQVKQLSIQQIPQREPLEIRAWGLDSDRAVTKARQLFGEKVSLRQMELTAVNNGRLVWSFDGKPLLDAMHGIAYDPENMR
jgi:hypothetical protein